MKTEVIKEVLGKIQLEWDISLSEMELVSNSSYETKLDLIEYFDTLSSFLNQKQDQRQWIRQSHQGLVFLNVLRTNPQQIKELNHNLNRLMNP